MGEKDSKSPYWSWMIAITLLLVIAASGYGIYSLLYRSKKIHHVVQKPIYVVSSPLQSARWNIPYKTYGSVQSQTGINVAAEVSGRLVKIAYAHPMQVKKGRLLFDIFNQAAVSQLLSDEATLRLDKLTLERKRKLVQQGVISRQEYDKAVKNYRFSQGQVRKDKATISLGNIYAPKSGLIGLNIFNVGDYVKSGDTLAILSPLEDMQIEFSIPAFYQSTIAVGDIIDYTTPVFPHRILHGTIARIDSAASSKTRQITIRAYFKNTQPPLIPGNFVDLTVYVGKKQNVFVVPEGALKYSLGGVNVFTILNGKAHFVPVTVVQRRDKWVAIKGKLSPNQSIISVGTFKVSNNTPVTTQKNATST